MKRTVRIPAGIKSKMKPGRRWRHTISIEPDGPVENFKVKGAKSVKQITGTNIYIVTFHGTMPEKITVTGDARLEQ